MPRTRAHTLDGRAPAGVALGLMIAAAGLLSGCSSAASGATGADASSASVAASQTAASVPAPVSLPLGQQATVPSDTIDVSRFLATAAPDARKPDRPGTHWASFSVKQCAVTDSKQGSWKVALADGTFASEPTEWPQELPEVLLPSDEAMPPGYCAAGRVYVAMPDGATATAIVLEPHELNPTRPEVRWVIGRTSAAS